MTAPDIFLQMNDQINSFLNRYEAFKKGDFTAAANPIPTELAGFVPFLRLWLGGAIVLINYMIDHLGRKTPL